MSDSLHYVCPHCHTTNRIALDQLGNQPDCGSCHQPLVTGEPVALDADSFARHTGRSQLPVVAAWAKPGAIMRQGPHQGAGLCPGRQDPGRPGPVRQARYRGPSASRCALRHPQHPDHGGIQGRQGAGAHLGRLAARRDRALGAICGHPLSRCAASPSFFGRGTASSLRGGGAAQSLARCLLRKRRCMRKRVARLIATKFPGWLASPPLPAHAPCPRHRQWPCP